MERIVGIDCGKKRSGVAVSDPLGIFASPLETVPSAGLVDFLKNYTQKEIVKLFVVGYPMTLQNQPAEAVKYVDQIISALKKHFPAIPVVKEDERFTSQLAFQSLIDSGVKKMDRRDKAAVDRVSAAIILQTYLDRKK
jgi:putative Holliday junction resolvase